MLRLLIALFSLFQLFHAQEFPNLMKHIEITWDKVTITNKLDVRQTMSTDGYVPSFILCGAFPTSENDGNCTLKYEFEYHPSSSATKIMTGNAVLKARLISSVNDSYSCMSFENNMTDFATLYALTEQDPKLNHYTFAYTCETIGAGLGFFTIFFLVVFFMFVFMMVILCGYKSGLRKNMGSSQQNVYNYRAYEPENPPVVYGGNPGYGAPTGNEAKTTTDGGHTLYTPFKSDNGY